MSKAIARLRAGHTHTLTSAMRATLFFVSLVSGAAALAYELTWFRTLADHFGVTIHATSTVLAIFMGGLAVGSLLAARWLEARTRDRGGVSAAGALVAYAVVELAIAGGALGFVVAAPWLSPTVAHLGAKLGVDSAALVLAKCLLATALLLPPAACMGATFPLLAAALADLTPGRRAALGALYAANAAGAVGGCLFTPLVGIPRLGITNTVLVAACANLGLAAVTFGLSRLARSTKAGDSGELGVIELPLQPTTSPRRMLAPGEALSYPTAAWLAIVAGFLTLAVEVLWTRLAANLLTSNTLVLAGVLAAFLSGIAAGGLVAETLARFARRPVRWLTALLLVSAVAVAASLLVQDELAQALDTLIRRASREGWPAAAAAFVPIAVIALAVAAPATLFGSLFPAALCLRQRSTAAAELEVGRLYASNTLAAVAGALVAGFAIIPGCGLSGGLLLLAGVYAAVGVELTVTAARPHWQVRARWSLLAALALLWLSMRIAPPRPTYWFNGGYTGVTRVPRDQTLFYKEGPSGSVGVMQYAGARGLTVGGTIVAETTREDLWDLLLKAHLPMLLHDRPRRVALVGLGAGVSLGATLAHAVERVDCVELSAEVIEAAPLFEQVNRRCWEDPRATIHHADGRQFLLSSGERYDVINVDPVDPPVCTLYTQDFFQLCHDRLADAGLMVEWVPLFHLPNEHLRGVVAAFAAVFEHTTLWYDGTSVLLIGRRGGALTIDAERFARRAARAQVAESLAEIGGPTPWLLLSTYLSDTAGARRLAGENAPLNTDDRPSLEYTILRAGSVTARMMAENLESLLPISKPVYERPELRHLPADDLAELQRATKLVRGLIEARTLRLRGERDRADELMATLAEELELNAGDLLRLRPLEGE